MLCVDFEIHHPSGTTISATAIPLSKLIDLLEQQTGRPIVDKTGLQGLFDFKLQFSADGLGRQVTPFGPIVRAAPPAGPSIVPAASDSFPSLFTAIQQQLGLKLESAKGPVQVFVIESVQKPVEN